MTPFAAMVIQAVLLASALSADAFVASFAYGSSKIKIPMLSIQIINLICSGILGISLLLGTLIKPYISNEVAGWVCFIVLFVLGITKLFDGITKSIIRKHNNLRKQIKFSMFNFKFILNLYADPQAADVDRSKVISASEAASLAMALSLDGIAVGFGAAVGNINGFITILVSLVINPLAVICGCYVGNKIAEKLAFGVSWFSGVLLIVLAFLRLT